MTEMQWLRSTDPTAMFAFLCDSRGESQTDEGRRRLRRFACECVRDIRGLLPDPDGLRALECAEQFLDGTTDTVAMISVGARARQAWRDLLRQPTFRLPARRIAGKCAKESAALAVTCLTTESFVATDDSVRRVASLVADAWAYDRVNSGHSVRPDVQRSVKLAELARYLRDIYANPFREVAFDPRWRTTAAVGVAEQIYDSREYGNLPVLADALQDAGCEIPAILSHCRDPGRAHVRGCWVVDLVLGKA